MISKSITYTDFNGEEQTDTFLFNLTKAELIKLNMANDGGIETALNTVIRSRNNAEIHDMFTKIIGMAYGEKSQDGRYFEKSPEILRKFESTEAYSELIMEMFTNTDALSAFVIGLMPADLVDQAGLSNARTPDEIMRASLEAKGGFQKKQAQKNNGVRQEPELPTQGQNVGAMGEPIVTQTADPIFKEDLEAARQGEVQSSVFEGKSDEEIAQMVRSGRFPTNGQ